MARVTAKISVLVALFLSPLLTGPNTGAGSEGGGHSVQLAVAVRVVADAAFQLKRYPEER